MNYGRQRVEYPLRHPQCSKKELRMTSDATLRRTEILVASLWLVTAVGAITGAVLINPVIIGNIQIQALFQYYQILNIAQQGLIGL